MSPSTLPPETSTLAGLTAVYTRATIRGQLVTQVRVPSLGAVFTLTSDSHQRADAILGSAPRVSTDDSSCAVAATLSPR